MLNAVIIFCLEGWCDILCQMLLTCLERPRMGRVWRQALFNYIH